MNKELIINHIKELVDSNKVAGASLIISKDDEVILNFNYGLANIEKGYPITDNSVFRLASMTKPVTAVAVLKAQELGLLKITDYIDEYLPFLKDFVIKDDKGNIVDNNKYRITIEQILHHCSGLGCNPTSMKEYSEALAKSKTLEELVNNYQGFSVEFIPGTRNDYCPCAGLDILARIIEVTSKMKYFEFIKKHILDPLDMTHTSYNYSNVKDVDKVLTYKYEDDKLSVFGDVNQTFDNFPFDLNGGGAGLISTKNDYLHFASMLTKKGIYKGIRILTEDSVKQMTTTWAKETPWGSFDTWGLTVHVREKPWTKIAKNSFGWSGAFGTHFWSDPTNKITVVYMHNSSTFGGSGAKHMEQLENDVYTE